MQKAFINTFYDIAAKNPNLLWLSADNGTDLDQLFFRDYPNQYFNLGIAEANMVGMAAGMASVGKIPFVFTGGTFLAYRAYEFIRDDVCFQNQNVKLVGFGSGMSISTLGPTHHATEDMAGLRALPNLTIFSPASPMEVDFAVRTASDMQGPVYIRMGMSGEAEIHAEGTILQPGRNVTLQDGENENATVLCTGSIASVVLEAAELLRQRNIGIRIVDVHTIKPFDRQNVIENAVRGKPLITVEEHAVTGGIGSAVAEVMAEENLCVPLYRIGLNDCFAHGYGTLAEMRVMNGFDAQGICERIALQLQETATRTERSSRS